MNELEVLLKEALATMEGEMRETQASHSLALKEQKRTLEVYGQTLQDLESRVSHLLAKQNQSAQHLQRLSGVHANLELLLVRLNDLVGSG